MNNSIKDEIFEYALNTYGIEPDYPFDSDPDTPVLRHSDNRKWFAILMNVSRSVLGLGGDGRVDVMNIKCDPILSGSLRLQKGYLPAYHMNHEKWLTILLDGTVPVNEIFPLLDMSFELTMKKYRKRADKDSDR